MQRSSASIGTLAAALAKAQAQLINPGEIDGRIHRLGWIGKGEQIFRDAPLSSGLDIVRKTLGQYEIATIQTTAVDQTAGIVNLTTSAGPFVGGMDRFGLAGLRNRLHVDPSADGSGAYVRPALCLIHAGRNCRRGRP